MYGIDIKCKECKSRMYWDGYASMGGSHSNYYKCTNRECGRVIEVYDREFHSSSIEINGIEYEPKEKVIFK